MKYSYKIGRLFGFPIRVHITFLLLLVFVGLFAEYCIERGAGPIAMLTIVLIFGCVVLHEVGHSIVARHFGVNVRSIVLLPIGGVAQMEDMPDDPMQEILIAITGPAVSVFLALSFLGLSHFLYPGESIEPFGVFSHNLLHNLFWINTILALFNLLPAFPMDGGRVVRGLLALRINKLKATRIAVGIGHVFAILFFFVGLFFNIWLCLIALFIYIGASSEERATEMKIVLHGVPVRQAMLTTFETITPDDVLWRVVERVCHTAQDDFPVVEGGRVVGLLAKGQIFRALKDNARDARVGDIMAGQFVVAHPDEPLFELFKRLSASEPKVALVMEYDQLLGIINMEQIGKYHLLCSSRRG